MKGDIGDAFEKLKKDMFFNYRGALVEKIIGGFKWGERKFITLQEVKMAIDEAYDTFNKIKP